MLKVGIMAKHSKRHQLKATRQWYGCYSQKGADVNAQGGDYDNAL
jgi:hypothetical protein